MTTLHLVDAFAEGPCTGNPAGVVLLAEERSADWMQAVAMEINQAETAFLLRQDGRLRPALVTPLAEVDLCGHATLAAAHFLWEGGHLSHDAAARFQTRSGVITAVRRGDGLISVDFPAIASHLSVGPEDLVAALKVIPCSVKLGDFDLLVEVADAATVRTLAPDLGAIGRWPFRGVLVTALGDQPGIDFVSRCFSRHSACLKIPSPGRRTVRWRSSGERAGRDTLTGWQASRRGGRVHCRVLGARVELSGRAVTTLRGELLL